MDKHTDISADEHGFTYTEYDRHGNIIAYGYHNNDLDPAPHPTDDSERAQSDAVPAAENGREPR